MKTTTKPGLEERGAREKTPVDAFRELLSGKFEETRGLAWSMTNLTREKTFLLNGLQYCSAEVTFSNGVQYGTDAYGDEATALHAEASRYLRDGSRQQLRHLEPILITA